MTESLHCTKYRVYMFPALSKHDVFLSFLKVNTVVTHVYINSGNLMFPTMQTSVNMMFPKQVIDGNMVLVN